MERFLVRVLLSALAVLAAGVVFQEWVSVQSVESALVFALILGVLNATVRPVFLLFTLPLNLVTLGLFTIVVNGFVFWLATFIPTGVQVNGFLGAVIGSLTVSFVSFVGSYLAR